MFWHVTIYSRHSCFLSWQWPADFRSNVMAAEDPRKVSSRAVAGDSIITSERSGASPGGVQATRLFPVYTT